MFAMLPFLCIFDINNGHCMFTVRKPAIERVFCYDTSNIFSGGFMAWQGIPFVLEKLEETLSSSNLSHLTIDKLPAVVVESSFSWESLLSAFIAGTIPAYIAYIAIKNSNRLAVLQNKMQSQTKIFEEIRIASANYVTALNMISSEYNQWAKSVRHHGVVLSVLQMPENLIKIIRDAELSKNTLTILIVPDEDGKKLISKMVDAQNALKPFLNSVAAMHDYKMLKKAGDDFTWACHEYLLEKQKSV
ncbi:hypothetical protein D7I40_00890 [Citrobacter sp. MH181794]|nr:hypothetical protein D7I40_00890 [Citrobacter sp. MH181794]